jgi:predicted MPP superfamily phosphohydrolase
VSRIIGALEDAGIAVLRNRAVALERERQRLWIAGADEPHQRRADLTSVFAPIAPAEPLLLLAHSPDILELPFSRPVGLLLVGHTHGGQVRLPGLRPLVTHTRVLLPDYRGWLQTVAGPMYINAGISASIPLRFRCPPEVTRFALRADHSCSEEAATKAQVPETLVLVPS